MQIIMDMWPHIAVTCVFVLWMIFGVFLPHRKHHSAPSELTTYGILGTFTGIFVGLWPFLMAGHSDITKHIYGLICGIAVAAVCSIFGMGLALICKNQQRVQHGKADSSANHEGATADTLADLLQKLVEQSAAGNSQLNALQRAMVGEDDGTLITQLQKMRTTFSDKQDELVKSFDHFAADMAKNNSDALVEALNDVIRDFNLKITEQFGENFKQLNEAVGQLLVWQKNYRDELTALQSQFSDCLKGIDAADTSLASIAEQASSLVHASERLEKLLLAYQNYESRLAGNLEVFAELSANAQSAFPIIQGNIKELTEGFSSAVRTSTNHMETTVDKTSRLLEEQVTKLDQALEAELTNSMKTMANQLASLSSKFVADYTPLTIELQKLVQLSSKAGNN